MQCRSAPDCPAPRGGGEVDLTKSSETLRTLWVHAQSLGNCLVPMVPAVDAFNTKPDLHSSKSFDDQRSVAHVDAVLTPSTPDQRFEPPTARQSRPAEARLSSFNNGKEP